jgi:hypothetical protein
MDIQNITSITIGLVILAATLISFVGGLVRWSHCFEDSDSIFSETRKLKRNSDWNSNEKGLQGRF